jgi:DNA-binding GntR family transcriptional regulator
LLLAWRDGAFPITTQSEHQDILNLCLARDRAGLMNCIERHIVASGDVVLRYLQALESK